MRVIDVLNSTISQSKVMIEWLNNKIKDNKQDLDCMAHSRELMVHNPFNAAIVQSELISESILDEDGVKYSFCKDYIEQGMDWIDPLTERYQ